jgi:hypothetical protein
MLLSLRPQQQTKRCVAGTFIFLFWVIGEQASFAGMGRPGVHICKVNNMARTKGVFGKLLPHSWDAFGNVLSKSVDVSFSALHLPCVCVCVLLTWSCRIPFGLNVDSL